MKIIQLNLTEVEAEVLKVGFTKAVLHIPMFTRTLRKHSGLLEAYNSLAYKLDMMQKEVGQSIFEKEKT